MSVSIHEHEFVVAERDALRRERDHWKANHDNRVAAAKVLLDRPDIPFERVHAYRAYVALQEQVDALRREVDRLKSENQKLALDYVSISGQAFDALAELAASQAREQQLREALVLAKIQGSRRDQTSIIDAALALPADTTALQAMIAQAGEVMRERCATATGRIHTISALPAITMDDLKGGA